MQETWAQSLGQEDPLEKEMATHSSILAWRIPWTEEPGGLQSMGSLRVGHDSKLTFAFQFPALAFGFLTAEKPGSPRDYLDDTLLCSTLCKAFILRKVFDSKMKALQSVEHNNVSSK